MALCRLVVLVTLFLFVAVLPAAVVAQGTTRTLTVTNAGGGTVTSSPAGINCGSDCTETYTFDPPDFPPVHVTLTATPDVGMIFTGWSGACSGTGTCQVTMSQNRSVTATFSIATFDLTVSLAGAGGGTVTSSPAGIDCGVDCSEDYDYNTIVTLTATPDVGSVFDGWSGDCTGTDPCNVTMDQARSVTATFSVATFELSVSLAGAGSGSVTSSPAGIDCGSDCSEAYDYNTEVTLTAAPDVGSVFGGWGGDCTGTGSCVVTMDQAHSVTATFEVGSFVLSVAKDGDGSGTVTSSPAGIDCGVDCSESYDFNTEVTLTATPTPSASVFTGWSGDCTGTGACNVTMAGARSVTATFDDTGFDFYTLIPCRVIDTRESSPVSNGDTLIIDVAGVCGVPVTAKAVSVNLTAVAGASGGTLTLFPGDGSVPNTLTVAFNSLNNRAVNGLVALASNGDGTVAVKVVLTSGGTMNVILDINGYFE